MFFPYKISKNIAKNNVLEEGYYLCRIANIYSSENKNNGASGVVVELVVENGESKGSLLRQTYYPDETNTNGKNREWHEKMFNSLLIESGFDDDVLGDPSEIINRCLLCKVIKNEGKGNFRASNLVVKYGREESTTPHAEEGKTLLNNNETFSDDVPW
jgi:hypothetical protein